jgi:predicted Zn finger-like uncharacterized protein
MLTQCPSCQTTFRVTSEILRVAHGQVRCGRCQTQFDALERLIEENDAGEIQSGRYLRPPREEPAEENIEVEEPQEQEDITLEGRHIEISGTYRVVDETGRHQHLQQEVTEEWVEIADDDSETEAAPEEKSLDEEALIEQEDLDAGEVEEEPSDEAPDQQYEESEAIEEEDVAVDPIAAEQRAARRGIAAHEPAHHEPDLFAPRPKPAVPAAWKYLAAPLAFLLAIQMIHHARATLARHPSLGPPLVALYRALGLPLQPDWNLHAYEVRQWGVASDPSSPGTLRVRASIKNLAEYAQPYPMLKLVLEDRWGEQVRAREFGPDEYLDPATAPDRLLAPAQQTNATIAIVDPGPDAEGFRFDVCLRGAHGPVCAGDVPAPR